jgi:thiamine biosynthesis lipoprotein
MKDVPGVHRFAHAAMATTFEIRCAHDDPSYARQAAEAAWAAVDRIEQDQSRFIANSDVSRVNALGAGQSARVSPWTMECLEIARRMYEVTAGAFDVSLGTGLDGLELLADDFTVVARRDGVALDLGGIGKGFAVDRIGELLGEWEIPRALVHGGWSSVLALDPPAQSDGWPLTLSAPGPSPSRVLERIAARRRALSASGTRKGDHIVDPRTGAPARRRAAWVAVDAGSAGEPASPAAVAETLSTALIVLTGDDAARLIARCPGVEAWVFEEGQVAHLTGAAIEDNDLP